MKIKIQPASLNEKPVLCNLLELCNMDTSPTSPSSRRNRTDHARRFSVVEVEMDYVRKVKLNGKDVTITWVGHTHETPARVYALAFASRHEVLLVSGGPDDPYRWLPGGGIEPGETPEQALRRELWEEAEAEIDAFQYIGSQRLNGADGFEEFQHFYWCHITLLPPAPVRLESTLRHLVPPEDFLDTLEWGRSDPKAAMLFEIALALEKKLQG